MTFNVKKWLAAVAGGFGTALLAAALALPAYAQGVAVGGGGGGGGAMAGGGGGGVRAGGGAAGRGGGAMGAGAVRGGGGRMPTARAGEAGGGGAAIRGQAGMEMGGMRGARGADARSEMRADARGMIDEVRGRGLDPLDRSDRRGGQDSFRETTQTGRERFRDSGEEARDTFRDTRRDAGEARAETRDATRESDDRQQAWREAQDTFRDSAREARDQFGETFRDARGTFADARQEAREQFLPRGGRENRETDRSFDEARQASRDERSVRDTRVDRQDTRDAASILRSRGMTEPSSGFWADEWELSERHYPLGRGTEGGLPQSLPPSGHPGHSELEEEVGFADQRSAAGRSSPRSFWADEWERSEHHYPGGTGTEGGLSESLEQVDRADSGASRMEPGTRRVPSDPATIRDRIATERELRGGTARLAGANALAGAEDQSGSTRVVAPVNPQSLPDGRLQGMVRGVHAHYFDPSEVGRDASPVFQSLYEGMHGPIPAGRPEFVPSPGVGFPPRPTVPATQPTTGVPATPVDPLRAADFGLTLNAAALAGGTLRIQEATGPFSNLGLRGGDTILALNGQRISSEAQLTSQLLNPQLFQTQMSLEVLRQGRFVEFTFVPSQRFSGLFR